MVALDPLIAVPIPDSMWNFEYGGDRGLFYTFRCFWPLQAVKS